VPNFLFTFFEFADDRWSHFTALRAPVQTEFALGGSHSCKTGSREACSGEVPFALPSVEGCPGEGTYRSGTQTTEHIIGTSTTTHIRIRTTKPIASLLTTLYRWPHVYHIPALMTIMARSSEKEKGKYGAHKARLRHTGISDSSLFRHFHHKTSTMVGPFIYPVCPHIMFSALTWFYFPFYGGLEWPAAPAIVCSCWDRWGVPQSKLPVLEIPGIQWKIFVGWRWHP